MYLRYFRLHRCDGTFKLVLCSSDKIPYLEIHDTIYKQYGYLCGQDEELWEGDNIAYVKQATENKTSMVITIMECSVVAGILSSRNFQSDYLWIGLNEINCKKLFSSHVIRGTSDSTCMFHNVTVSFTLKHSYFNRMHQALDALSPEVVQTFFPKPNNFSDIKNGPNLFCDVLDIQPDMYGQQQALNIILSSKSKAIVLITGPFGTGKTLLLAHAVYHVMNHNQKARILVCTHHKRSADAFVERYFGPMKAQGWKPNLVRLDNRNPPPRSPFQCYFMQKSSISKDVVHKLQVVVSTFGNSLSLLNVLKQGFFTHIFVDEAAQTREPETISPLCLASSETKIVIAGDHCQVFFITLCTLSKY